MKYILLISLFFVGCATPEFVAKNTSKDGSPQVAYRYNASSMILRNKSISSAKEFCGGGKVKVLSEFNRTDLDWFASSIFFEKDKVGSSEYGYIFFECLEKNTKNEEIY